MATVNATSGFVSVGSPHISSDKALRQKIKALPERPREIAKHIKKAALDFEIVAGGRLEAVSSKRQEIVKLKADDPFVDWEEIREIEKQISDLESLHAATIPLKNTWEAVSAWLLSKKAETLMPWRGSVPKGNVAELVASKKREIAYTERAPISTADAKARGLADVEALIASGAPDIANTTQNSMRLMHTNTAVPGGIRRSGGGIIWPKERIKREVTKDKYQNVGTDTDHFVFGGLAFTAWLMQDQLRSRISKMCDEIPKQGLTNNQRETKLKTFNAELIDLQYALGAQSWAAICDGSALTWPHDLPAACILGVVPNDSTSMERFLKVRAADD